MLKTIQRLVLSMFTAICVMAALPALAQTHQETVAKAEAGDMFAQFQMGLDYELGQGVEVDKAQAAKWYQKSIDSGLHWAYGGLAKMYETGEGVPKDAEKAKHYAAIAMEKTLDEMIHPEKYGHIRAHYNKIEARERDEKLRLAENGDLDAQNELAQAYLEGRNGFEQSDQQALYWFKKAADQGDSSVLGAWLILGGDLDLSPEAAKAKAIEWHKAALKNGNSEAEAEIEAISRMSLDEVIDEQRFQKYRKAEAILSCDQNETLPCSEYLKKAALLQIKALAELGVTAAEAGWGISLLDEGAMAKLDAKPDPNAAIAYLNKAAEKNDENAMLFLARVYEHGRGVPKDTAAALMWYDRVMVKMTTERAEAAKNNHYISGGNDTLIQCKLYFLRGDKIADHTRQECTAWDREAFYRAY
ncbi:hypothetical protein OVA03_00130 [Asticcacaulis sp. SL142]|uniref:SEL1-like repeat protein n=1 Tax=Asticcacaulis sp. SL142 TaxID=2995155 RepID=UPI00226D2B8A|nr:hypothetical protein [Asticcacaulis sp. SL142]WAC48379.1 hypothetical protein OVA03_00130 [Asticcacaulis sp. SL142]